MLYFLLALLIAYLLGSIPFSVLAGKIKGIDIMSKGSGNPGTTNTFRVLGAKFGIAVFLCDTAKGAAAVLIGQMLLNQTELPLSLDLFFGISAILGHSFSPFLRFKGGRGVAAGAGAFAVLTPIALLWALGTFCLITFTTRYVSLGSLSAAAVLVVSELTVNHPNYTQWPYLLATVVVCLFVFYTHRSNMARLHNGTENRFKYKKR